MASILVTGAAGYIGSVLVPRLLEEGHSVIALDSFLYQQTSLIECCASPRFQLVRGDVRDVELISTLLRGVDAIIPLACLTGAPICKLDPVGATTINRDAIREIIRLRAPSQPIVFPTTNSGYGIGEKDRACTEESPLRPVSLYGRLKVEIERELLDAGNVVTLRLATVFGASPRMRTALLVNDFVLRAVRDRFVVLFEADFRRNFLHVRDAADAFVHVLENFERMRDRPYNVGLSEANITKRQLCEEIKGQVPDFFFCEAPMGEDPDKRDYIVSNDRMEATGFRARRSLREGIAELVKAYRVFRAFPTGNV